MENKAVLARNIISSLGKDYPDPKTELVFRTPHQLLVATILSAQCTDKRVNLVTKGLFRKYRSVKDFAEADIAEFEQDIHSTGFYKNKAKNIIGSSRMILGKYQGKVPETMEELITLPGVARKTANVVLFEAFGKQEGIAVDTHVVRLSNLLGIVQSPDPKKIEQELMSVVPRKDWGRLSNLLILHGRSVCIARRPRCEACCLKKICPSASGNPK